MSALFQKRRDRYRDYGGWVRVAIAPNAFVAGFLEGALRSEDIPVLLKKMGLGDFPTSPGNQRAVMVPGEREQEARRLLSGIWDISG